MNSWRLFLVFWSPSTRTVSGQFALTIVIDGMARQHCKLNYNDRYMNSISLSPKAGRRRFDRDEALETAMKLFWRHGYESTSMSDLLKAMGLTAPSLYSAF